MSQAPTQNQTNLNKDTPFFAPASTLGASGLGVVPDLPAGFLTFGPGGALTGSGLKPLGIIGGPGRVSTLAVVTDNTNAANSFAAGGVYFDTPSGILTSCSLIEQSASGVEQINIFSRNLNAESLIVSCNLAISTINGLPYVTSPGSTQFTLQAGDGNTVGSNAAIVTFAVPYTSASTLSIVATPRNTLNTTFHPLTLSAISQSTFVVTSDTTGVGFSWVANGPVA